ncbi:MAG: TolC family protein, partial [Candidatus Omnitrophica bacterium]|nr:TolC family protein [Candidatus Omnitrophota bacterium]
MRPSFVRIQSFIAVNLAAVLAGGPSVSASSQLPALLAELKAKNPSLREARTRWEAAQARIPLSKGLPAPRIGVEFEEIPKGGVKLNQATIMYQLVQSLPFPGKLSARHRVAVAEAQVAAAAFKQTEWDLIAQLKASYYDVWMLDRELEVVREQLIWVSQAVTAAQARYATGVGEQADLLRLQAEALQTGNEVEVLRNRLAAAAAHLNHLLTRPSHEPVDALADIPLQELTVTPDELWLIAQERQPELLVMRYSVERAEAEWR